MMVIRTIFQAWPINPLLGLLIKNQPLNTKHTTELSQVLTSIGVEPTSDSTYLEHNENSQPNANTKCSLSSPAVVQLVRDVSVREFEPTV